MYDIRSENRKKLREGETNMLKKILVYLSMILCFLLLFNVNMVYAGSNELIDDGSTSQLIEIKDKEKKELQDYNEAYGSETYGLTAYILSKVRIYSIPFCFIGIAVGAIYQYVIGIRKLDVRDRGMILIVSFVTILVICQVLPLVFTIVVRGWRS